MMQNIFDILLVSKQLFYHHYVITQMLNTRQKKENLFLLQLCRKEMFLLNLYQY
jgi:hypothetical protein